MNKILIYIIYTYNITIPLSLSVFGLLDVTNTCLGSLLILPQTIVCTANVHMLPSVGTSVQVTVVWVVVVGQLPQFDIELWSVTIVLNSETPSHYGTIITVPKCFILWFWSKSTVEQFYLVFITWTVKSTSLPNSSFSLSSSNSTLIRHGDRITRTDAVNYSRHFYQPFHFWFTNLYYKACRGYKWFINWQLISNSISMMAYLMFDIWSQTISIPTQFPMLRRVNV